MIPSPLLRETVRPAGRRVIAPHVVDGTYAVVDAGGEFLVADALSEGTCILECFQCGVEPPLTPRDTSEAEVRLGCQVFIRDVDDGSIRGDCGNEVAGVFGTLTCGKLLWADHFSLIKRVSDGDQNAIA